MTCPHLWTPSLEPRTVVHSWYRHVMNEAATLDKEEEELNSELLEIKNRCKRAAIPGVYRFKHGEGYSDEELLMGEDAPEDDSEYDDIEDDDDDDDEEEGEDLDEDYDEEVEEEPEEEEGTVYYSDDNDDRERVVSLASPPHDFEDDEDDPDLPALISESSDTPEEIFSPPVEISITSPTERRTNDNVVSSEIGILPATGADAYSRNHEVDNSEDFTSRSNLELNLVPSDNYDAEDMEELDNLLPSD